ncbi:MAG: hypothetical protein NW215_10570 [Hyphomicrobiales bacterium]|nr:hypothetical protein [Hyphomicrobiales bacterium]
MIPRMSPALAVRVLAVNAAAVGALFAFDLYGQMELPPLTRFASGLLLAMAGGVLWAAAPDVDVKREGGE